MPLAGGFLKDKSDFQKEKVFPLTLAFCRNCYLLQTREVISKEILFNDYFYHSSAIKTLVKHFADMAAEVAKEISPTNNKFIVEIGCNDGSFIKSCLNKGFRAVGIDPATNVVNLLLRMGFRL